MCLDPRKPSSAPVLAAAGLAEIERLRAEVADLKIKILAAVSVLTGFADRLGVDDDSLADMLADAQMRAEDDRDGP